MLRHDSSFPWLWLPSGRSVPGFSAGSFGGGPHVLRERTGDAHVRRATRRRRDNCVYAALMMLLASGAVDADLLDVVLVAGARAARRERLFLWCVSSIAGVCPLWPNSSRPAAQVRRCAAQVRSGLVSAPAKGAL